MAVALITSTFLLLAPSLRSNALLSHQITFQLKARLLKKGIRGSRFQQYDRDPLIGTQLRG